MENHIKTYGLTCDGDMYHIEGVLKVVAERTFVTIMTFPFDGLVYGEHYYGSDKNNYNFSVEAVVARAEWNLFALYEIAIDISDNFKDYKEVLDKYNTYKMNIDKKLSSAESIVSCVKNEYDKKALDFYIEGLKADSDHYYEQLLTERNLHKVNIKTLEQVVDYYTYKG